jgi:hypothetical protein
MLKEILNEMEESELNEAKIKGMEYEDVIAEEMLKIHKKLGSKSTGNVFGWKIRKGASVPAYYEESGKIPTKKSPKDILKFSSAKNHVFWVEMTDGSAILFDRDMREWWFIPASSVERMEANWKRVPIDKI